MRNRRILSDDFMSDLQGGFLNPVLAVVQADSTLTINIRRNCINIYYRGGNLMRIARQVRGSYVFQFDSNYCAATTALGTLPVVDCAVLPTKVLHGDSPAVAAWVSSIPLLKSAMDLHFGRNPKDEREFQQLIERTNNRNYATEYFICDIEYLHPGPPEQRFDMVAMRWPVAIRRSGSSIGPSLAMIEFKFREAALGGTSGVCGHVEKLRDMLATDAGFFAELADEMAEVFNQRVELGLVQCHKNGFMRKIETIDSSRPEYIILLGDHYPASSELATALDEVAKMQNGLPFEVKIATANFMGYALYGECISTLDDFRARYASQIQARGRVSPPTKTP